MRLPRCRPRLTVLALAVSLCLPLLPMNLHAAAGEIAVGPFTGRRAARLRARVSSILRRAGYRVVRWRRGGGDAARISGRVGRAGRSWRATLVLHRGGRKISVVGWRSRRSREMTHVPGRAKRRLLAALATARGATAGVAAVARRPRRAKAPAAKPAKPASTKDRPESRTRANQPATGGGEPGQADPESEADVEDVEDVQPGQGEEDDSREALSTEETRPRRAGRRSLALEATLGMHVLTRQFSYHDVLFGGLRVPPRSTAAAIGGTFDWYPAAHFTGGLLARIGLTGSFRYAVAGVGTLPSNGVDYAASISSAGIGLTGWHRLWRRLLLQATVGFGLQSFSISDVEDATRRHPSPSSEFRFLRLGVGAEMRVWRRLSAAVRARYLAVLDSGELTSERFFPHASAGGVETAIELSYALRLGFAVRLGADLRRFFVSFNPEPGDRAIAGGAVDQYLTVSAALVYRLRWRR